MLFLYLFLSTLTPTIYEVRLCIKEETQNPVWIPLRKEARSLWGTPSSQPLARKAIFLYKAIQSEEVG
jgi:hypothetical protein